MTARLINPDTLAAPRGYSHGAIAEGRLLAIAGQIGWDREGRLVSTEFAPQFEQALSNLVEVLRAAGGEPEDLLYLRIYVTEKHQYLAARSAVGASYRAHLGRHYPPMALLEVRGLLEDGALVELEGLAVLPKQREHQNE